MFWWPLKQVRDYDKHYNLIKEARNASAVGTLVERTSLFVTLAKVDNARTEEGEKVFCLAT